MKKFEDLLELLFEHRNKAYGAYQLRRDYDRTMRNSLFLGLSLPVLALLVAGFWSGNAKPVEPAKIPGDITLSKKMEIEPEILPKIEPIKTLATILETSSNLPPLVIPNQLKEPEKPVADPSKGQTASSTNVNQTGQPTGPTGPTGPIGPFDPGPSIPPNLPAEPPKPEPEKIHTFVSEMPVFPGGEAELLKFIAKNYKVPPIARETGIQGKVFISFVVETDGSLSDIVVVRDPGGGLGKEAIRVLQSMPNWAAGNQNGRAVRVRMNLPITVCLQ